MLVLLLLLLLLLLCTCCDLQRNGIFTGFELASLIEGFCTNTEAECLDYLLRNNTREHNRVDRSIGMSKFIELIGAIKNPQEDNWH